MALAAACSARQTLPPAPPARAAPAAAAAQQRPPPSTLGAASRGLARNAAHLRQRSGPVAAVPPRADVASAAAAVAEEAPPAAGSAAAPHDAPQAARDAAPAQQAAPPAPAPQQPPGGMLGLDAEALGKLCLLGVAMLWGSYNPMLKLLYAQDGPPGPVMIMVFRGVLQSLVLVGAYWWALGSARSSSDGSAQEQQQQAAAAAAGGEPGADANSSLVPAWVQRISSGVPFTAVAATELGLWLFLATGIQTVGLQLTTATRAGFLIQATALLTPLLASFTGQKPSRNVWLGCIVALAGCLCIAADAAATDADDVPVFSLGGDAAILSAAFFFSLATVRLGTYARHIPSVELAAAKSVVLGTAAVATFGLAAASMLAAGDPLTDLWPGFDNPLAWGILVYSALGPGAAAAFLHAKGQATVPPADAQVIFSSVPLWSIAFAFLLLGGEPMSQWTFVGGAAVVGAGLIASRKPQPPAAADEKQA